MFIENHRETLGKPRLSMKSIGFLRKTIIFNENHCKTLGKPIFSKKIIATP